MPDTHLWIGTDGNWGTAGNWNPSGPPVAGDGIAFASDNALPSSNYNTGPLAFGTVTYSSTKSSVAPSLATLIGSGNTCGALTINNATGASTFSIDCIPSGDVSCNWEAGKTLTVSVNVTGAIAMTGGGLVSVVADVATGLVGLTNGSDLSIVATKTLTANVTAGNGSSISAGAGASAGTIVGTVTASAAGVTITWTNLAIAGNIAAAGFNITHSGTGGTLTVNAAATLDAGTATAAAFAVNVTNAAGTVTISKLLTTGAVTFNAAGSITLPVAMQTGNFTVTTVATLTCNAAGSTVTVGGNLSGTAITTLTNNLDLTLTGTCNAAWAPGPPRWITATGAVTQTGLVVAKGLAGNGTWAFGGQSLRLYTHGDTTDFWTFTGTCSGAGEFYPCYYASGARANSVLISCGAANFRPAPTSYDMTLTLAAGLTTTGQLIFRDASTKVNTLVCNGPFSVGAITLGTPPGTDIAKLTLAAGYDHSFTSVTRAATNTATTHELNLNGKIVVSGNMTLAGIAVDWGSAKVTVGGNVVGTDGGTQTNTGAVIYGDGGTQITNLNNTSVTPIYAYKASRAVHAHRLGLDAPKPSLDCDEANSSGNTKVRFRNLISGGLSRSTGRGRKTSAMGNSRRRLTRA